MWLCARMGYHCFEKNIEPYDVYTADGAFFTGTPFCMLPVTKLNYIDMDEPFILTGSASFPVTVVYSAVEQSEPQ